MTTTTDPKTRPTPGPRSVLARRVGAGTDGSPAATTDIGDDPPLLAAVQAHVDGDLEVAIDRYEDLRSQRPENPTITNNLGLALLQAGRADDALAVLRQLEPIESLSSVALTNLANAHIAVGDATSGIRLLERAVTLDPAASAWVSLGKARLVSGDIDGAVRALETGVGLAPGRTDAWRLLGACLASRGDHRQALRAFRVVVDQEPSDAQAWRQLSAVLLARCDVGSAVDAALQAVDLAPDDVAVRRQLAMAYVALGEAGAAAAQLDALLDAHESWDDELRAVAVDRAVLAMAGAEHDRARSLLERVGATADGRARFHLAQLDLAGGDVATARGRLEKLAGEAGEISVRARELLDEIGSCAR